MQLAPVADAAADAPTPGQSQVNGPRQRRSLLPTELCAARLYNMIFCVHVDPERQQVLLYPIPNPSPNPSPNANPNPDPIPNASPNPSPNPSPHPSPSPHQVLLYQLFKDFVVRKFALHLYARQVSGLGLGLGLL